MALGVGARSLTPPANVQCHRRSFLLPSALIQGDVGALHLAGVHLTRTTDLRVRVGEHLAVLGDPSGDAAKREQRREHRRIETDRAVYQAGVEVDIRIQVT